MGRKLKYKTPEEKIAARREWQMNHYWKNQKSMQEKALGRYYKRKNKKNIPNVDNVNSNYPLL